MTERRLDHPLADGFAPAWAAEWGEDRHGPFVAFAVGDVIHRMRWVPGGTFWMGAGPDDDEAYGDEMPRHLVTLSDGLWLGETPVTQDLWTAVMGNKPSHFEGPRRPVESVSWDDAQRFIATLERLAFGDAHDGRRCRLPTEAEWERACRVGDEAPRYGAIDEVAWWSGNSGGSTHDVGGRTPNAWGLHDMLGNVWEWCEDCNATYPADPVADPVGPAHGTDRVFRGGSFDFSARGVRAASRLAYHPSYANDVLGFRLARGHALPAPEAEQKRPPEAGAG